MSEPDLPWVGIGLLASSLALVATLGLTRPAVAISARLVDPWTRRALRPTGLRTE